MNTQGLKRLLIVSYKTHTHTHTHTHIPLSFLSFLLDSFVDFASTLVTNGMSADQFFSVKTRTLEAASLSTYKAKSSLTLHINSQALLDKRLLKIRSWGSGQTRSGQREDWGPQNVFTHPYLSPSFPLSDPLRLAA